MAYITRSHLSYSLKNLEAYGSQYYLYCFHIPLLNAGLYSFRCSWSGKRNDPCVHVYSTIKSPCKSILFAREVHVKWRLRWLPPVRIFVSSSSPPPRHSEPRGWVPTGGAKAKVGITRGYIVFNYSATEKLAGSFKVSSIWQRYSEYSGELGNWSKPKPWESDCVFTEPSVSSLFRASS